jgi:endo-beta-N-acetylglucosaminidase D
LERVSGNSELHVRFVVSLVAFGEEIVGIDHGAQPVGAVWDAGERNGLPLVGLVILINRADIEAAQRSRVRAGAEIA